MGKPYQTPARLYVILAREANKAVILRRGPSQWVRVILWHTDTDEFECGQWLRGRIYGERCNLSPDGSLFVYFAAQHHNYRNGYLGTWTAISKPPYLTALALWPKGDTWGGGGMFIDNQTVYLSGCGLGEPHPDHQPIHDLRVIRAADQLTKQDHITLEKVGAQDWKLVHRSVDPSDFHAYGRRTNDPTVWHLKHPTNNRYYLIQRYCGYMPKNYPTSSIIEYALSDQVNKTEIPLSGANWANWDQQGRLVYVRDGQVFAQNVQQVGTLARPIADFNDQVFEDMLTPDWAKTW